MDVLFLIGSGAVGKMTVGQELMKICDFRLFHNHMMIEPVIEIFGKFDGQVVNTLRENVIDAFLKTSYSGMIFTYMWAFDMPSDWEYIKGVAEKFESTGGTAYYVELIADRSVRIERNKSENRLRNKASKRDIKTSEERMLREETKYRVVSNEGELPFKNYMRIDNTFLEPQKVAHMIKEHFNLPGKSLTELMSRIVLEEVQEHELEILHAMQVEAFMPLYNKYHDDECSPAKESLEKIKARAFIPERKYFFIVRDGARVGAINIGPRQRDCRDCDDSVMYISPVFVLPKFQNEGIASAAIKKAIETYAGVKTWRLGTILEEEKNCHLYEKLGFVQTNEKTVVNESMTIVGYEFKR